MEDFCTCFFFYQIKVARHNVSQLAKQNLIYIAKFSNLNKCICSAIVKCAVVNKAKPNLRTEACLHFH